MFRNNDRSDDSIEHAKIISDRTGYYIMPGRKLFPHKYEHPASSLNGKKALLLSLGPSLEEAEKQRKLDVAACEDFTRCRVDKSRSLRSSYEYRDIDSNIVISEPDYEKRYIFEQFPAIE